MINPIGLKWRDMKQNNVRRPVRALTPARMWEGERVPPPLDVFFLNAR